MLKRFGPGLAAVLVLASVASSAEEPPLALSPPQLRLPNALDLNFAEQPVTVPLSTPAPAGFDVVLNADGRVVGQVARDRKQVFLRASLKEGQPDVAFTLGRAGAPLGLANPVTIADGKWKPIADQPGDNGVDEYWDVTNGLVGVRIPKSLRANALPSIRVPTPVIGVQFPDGEWAGRPDFRAIVVPAWDSFNNVIKRVAWQFDSFKAEIVENGPERVTARITFGGKPDGTPLDVKNEARMRQACPYLTEPAEFAYEVTLYANEQVVGIRQLKGRPNDWVIDLNLFKPTPWRPDRWRTGNNHHYESHVVELEPGAPIEEGWTAGPGPAHQQGLQRWEWRGQGEGDLFSHDVWVEYSGSEGFGKNYLTHVNGKGTWLARTKGIPVWWPWNEVGHVLWAFARNGAPNAPVAGIMTGPCSQVTGCAPGDNPNGSLGFIQHIPSLCQENPYATCVYMENWRYDGVADKTKPLFGVKWGYTGQTGSFFLWLGTQKQNEPDIQKVGDDELGPVWSDWVRWVGGFVNIDDAITWDTNWPDPKTPGAAIEPAVLAGNQEHARKGEYMGSSSLIPFWQGKSDQEQLNAIDEFLKFQWTGLRNRVILSQHGGTYRNESLQWYTFDRHVAQASDALACFLSLGRTDQGGKLDLERWRKLKTLASCYFQQAFDEDRAMFWNDGVVMAHGGGSMTSDALSARMGIVRLFPEWPGSSRYSSRAVLAAEDELVRDIGRWGAQFTSVHYSSMAAITPMLAQLTALQWRSYEHPESSPDEYARDPRLRHFAMMTLNRMGVADPRHGNKRVPPVMGNAGPGWGIPALALLSGGFRHVDPQLASWCIDMWRENGSSHFLSPLLALFMDYDLKGAPYPFPPIASFPGYVTIHRMAPRTPNESAVYITNGSFFNQHREANEGGEVQIDALGRPIVTNPSSYNSPAMAHTVLRNVVGPDVPEWNKDGWYAQAEAWPVWNNYVLAWGAGKQGSFSRTRIDNETLKRQWTREVCLVHADDEYPVIVIRDRLNQPGTWIASFWILGEGPIGLPDGQTAELPRRELAQEITSTDTGGPALRQTAPLKPGVNSFRFSSPDWMKRLAKSCALNHITDLGPQTDVELHSINAGPIEAVVGRWVTPDAANRFGLEQGEGADDRQFVRLRFTGQEHVTVFTPYRRGQRPKDFAVSNSKDGILVAYTGADGKPRQIRVSAKNYDVSIDGRSIETWDFPEKVPTELYTGAHDLPYPGELNAWGSPWPHVEVKDGPAWANGVYEQIPPEYVTGMLHHADGIRDPFQRLGKGLRLDAAKPCFRSTVGDRMAYLLPIVGRGWIVARLPGGADEGWLAAPDAATPQDATGWTEVDPKGAAKPIQATIISSNK